ncbi:putative transcriptional coactivator Hfi1/Transcriptional adapter 1 [Helianthus annuus]|nr:putative transcriptional coactivator Hfi1/Transcriptional adapter 1 [Helianthus annuus]
MQPPEQRSWINLSELKGQIIRKLGPERSKQYFDYLNKFLNLKLSKVEFDKLCVRTVGRDGISLHNQLIRSILRNACAKKVPDGNKKPLDGVFHQNGPGPIIPNGDVLPTSPRKARTTGRERKGGDRKSALGPHSEDFSNGPNDARRPVHHHQELHAPLGIPYYPVSIGGSRRAAQPTKSVGGSHTNCLLDTITLRARMEPIVATQGLQGVSVDGANALNIGLNAYLKRIVRSCSELTRPIKTGLDHETKRSISLQDFRVAMELNPQQLGEDSPILLERICTHAFEE